MIASAESELYLGLVPPSANVSGQFRSISFPPGCRGTIDGLTISFQHIPFLPLLNIISPFTTESESFGGSLNQSLLCSLALIIPHFLYLLCFNRVHYGDNRFLLLKEFHTQFVVPNEPELCYAGFWINTIYSLSVIVQVVSRSR